MTANSSPQDGLVKLVSRSGAPSGSEKSVAFTYDGKSRRISKTVSNWVSGAWQLESTNRFVYDGWNLIAVLSSSSQLLSAYTWGLDLSGTLQGAGGVGGLLMLTNSGNGAHFCAYDGNGNVAALVKATDGTVSANYEYGPFGEALRVTGTMGKANPFRFSSKYQDEESDFLYYGYRSYNPSMGRWISRDPVDESGFCALRQERTSCGGSVTPGHYYFAENDPASKCDPLGLEIYINVCFISCECRWNIHAVWSATPRPAALDKIKLCCRAAGQIFCSSTQNHADRIAAQIYFQVCVAGWAGL